MNVVNWLERAHNYSQLPTPRMKRLPRKERISRQRAEARRKWYVTASALYLMEEMGYCVGETDLNCVYDLVAVSPEETLFIHVCLNAWPDQEMMEPLQQVPRPPSVRFVIHRWHSGGGAGPDLRKL